MWYCGLFLIVANLLLRISLNKNKEKMKKIVYTLLTVSMLFACSKDEDSPTPEPTPTPTPTYTVPTTYAFTDGSGNSTVDFSGQAARLEMLSEMVVYMKTGNNLGTTLSATTLKSMYANNGYIWVDAPGLSMTGSTKQLKDKTAAGDVGIQALFENYMDSIALHSSLNYSNSTQTYGSAGVWTDGTKKYLMAANGYEYGQIIEKGLMCAVFMNQMTVNYLGLIATDDNTALVSGKNYTVMQHHWDEAYGYFTSATNFPTSGTDRFWGKYSNVVEPITGSASKITEAFRKGRAAIDNDDYTTRDAQITIIRNEMEKICAGSAIHYLNQVKTNITNNIVKNHELSEARAFLDGLRFGYNSTSSIGMTAAEINTALTYIEDFENITISDLNNAIDLIASKTGLTSVKGSL